MTEAEQKLAEESFDWVKAHEKEIIRTFIDGAGCSPDDKPTAIFMAGSPGAGKTEVARALTEQFKQKPVRIDADEIRALCPGYSGTNAHVFQHAATKGVHKLYDYALGHSLNIILDGTFAYADSIQNIERALRKEYLVELYFIYQDPKRAWEFVQIREAKEQRRVTKETFIDSFFKSRNNAEEAKKHFGDSVILNLVVKDYAQDSQRLELNTTAIDPYLPVEYTEETLSSLLI